MLNNKIKIIFLDFDGVILPLKYENGKRVETEFDVIVSRDAVANLNTIIALTRAKIVVSSSWRLARTVADLRSLLHRWGVLGEILDKTPADDPLVEDRGQDIRSWLMHSPDVIDEFVIIDDIETDLTLFGERFVQTVPEVGLTFNDALKAISILRGNV